MVDVRGKSGHGNATAATREAPKFLKLGGSWVVKGVPLRAPLKGSFGIL